MIFGDYQSIVCVRLVVIVILSDFTLVSFGFTRKPYPKVGFENKVTSSDVN